jgi:hypothetical protein
LHWNSRGTARLPAPRACESEGHGFLQGQAPALLGWYPNMADNLVSNGRATGVDPRLMAAIPAMEGGNGKKFVLSSNNPFGLGPGNTYPTRGSERDSLIRDVFLQLRCGGQSDFRDCALRGYTGCRGLR